MESQELIVYFLKYDDGAGADIEADDAMQIAHDVSRRRHHRRSAFAWQILSAAAYCHRWRRFRRQYDDGTAHNEETLSGERPHEAYQPLVPQIQYDA